MMINDIDELERAAKRIKMRDGLCMMDKMTDDQTRTVLSWAGALLDEATRAHDEQMAIVQGYRDSYLGYSLPEATDGSSNMKMLDIMKAVEGALPSLVTPFIGSNIVTVEANDLQSEGIARLHEDAINKTWNKKNNPLETIEVLARNQMVDGTAWVRTVTDAHGNPGVVNVQFESVIPDPTATKVEDLQFCFYRDLKSISDILSNPTWYGKHTLTSLASLSAPQGGSSEYNSLDKSGQDDTFNAGQRALEKVELFELYCYYDNNNSGIATPHMIIFSENTLLNIVERPFPEYVIPFDNAVYVKDPFSIYGKGVAALIDEHQTFRTAITRGIVDNMANSNNGIKFIKKGTLDAVNFSRLLNKERVVELNIPTGSTTQNVIYDGSYNPIPADVYKLMADLEEEEENLTGITKYAVGSDSRSLNSTATGVNIITSMSQKRLIFVTQHISHTLTRVFKKWASINELMLNIPNDDVDITVKTGSAGLQAKKVADINMAMQVLVSTGNKAVVNQLAIELMEELDLHKAAAMLKQPSQDKTADITTQIGVEKEMAAIAKDQASAQKYKAEAFDKTVDATIKSLGGEV